MSDKPSALGQLETVMKETSKAIRAGDFTAMSSLATEMEVALAKLTPDEDVARFTALRALAQKNAAGLEAAGRGVRAARRRMAEIAGVTAGGKTYNDVGKTQKIAKPDTVLKARF